mgnify:CR=1 FL=1
MAYRRAGPAMLNGMQYLEIVNDKTQNDLSGWYTTTFDVRLVSYSRPVQSAGFGTDLNRLIFDKELKDRAHAIDRDENILSDEFEYLFHQMGDDKI